MSDDVVEVQSLRRPHERAREVSGEVLAGPERRRRWSTEQKLRILAQSIQPGSSATLVCRLHGISSGQLYTWRRQFRMGELTGFAPVAVIPDPVPARETTPKVAPARPEGSSPTGSIALELASGIKVWVDGEVDEAALRRVLSVLADR
jgi:transposase